MFYSIKLYLQECATKFRVSRWVLRNADIFRNPVEHHQHDVIKPDSGHPFVEQGLMVFDNHKYRDICSIADGNLSIDTWEFETDRKTTRTMIHQYSTPCVLIPSWMLSDDAKSAGREHNGSHYFPIYHALPRK